MGAAFEELHRKLTDSLNTVKMEVAGRLVYFDEEHKLFILGVHTVSPEKTEEAGNKALDAIRDTILPEIIDAGFGFATKQI